MAALMPFLGQERDQASMLLLQVIASILDELIRKGELQRQNNVNKKLTKFHGLRAPSIALPDYLNRIAQFSGCSNEAFVLMLIYLDRLVTNKDIPLDSLNVHRLVITGTLLAAKFFDDHYLDNSHYSAVGGLPRNEINELELEMLFLLGFNLYVTTENYNTYYNTLTNMAQSRTIQSPPVLLPTPAAPSGDHQQGRQQQHLVVQQQVVENDQWVCVNSYDGMGRPSAHSSPLAGGPGFSDQQQALYLQQQQQQQYVQAQQLIAGPALPIPPQSHWGHYSQEFQQVGYAPTAMQKPGPAVVHHSLHYTGTGGLPLPLQPPQFSQPHMVQQQQILQKPPGQGGSSQQQGRVVQNAAWA